MLLEWFISYCLVTDECVSDLCLLLTNGGLRSPGLLLKQTCMCHNVQCLLMEQALLEHRLR